MDNDRADLVARFPSLRAEIEKEEAAQPESMPVELAREFPTLSQQAAAEPKAVDSSMAKYVDRSSATYKDFETVASRHGLTEAQRGELIRVYGTEVDRNRKAQTDLESSWRRELGDPEIVAGAVFARRLVKDFGPTGLVEDLGAYANHPRPRSAPGARRCHRLPGPAMTRTVGRRLTFLEGQLNVGCPCQSGAFQLVEPGEVEEVADACSRCGRQAPVSLIADPYALVAGSTGA